MYMETQVTTTSQGQVLIMLYDGAIKFLNQAKELIAVKDYAGKGKLISSAIDVINELASSLNAEKGGELAANLNQLYFYCNKRLFMANSRMDISAIDEVIKILSGIRSAYAQIIDTPEAVAAMAANTAMPSSKAPRAPMGLTAAPMPGPPVSTLRARNAYNTQSAAVSNVPAPESLPAQEAAPLVPEAAPASVASAAPQSAALSQPAALAQPATPAQPAALATQEPAKAESVAKELANAEPVTELAPPAGLMPDLDFDTPPPSISQGKRMAASNLYRKFAAS